jgi:hypothetical protein
LSKFEAAGLMATGTNPETGLVEIIELKNHPYFLGVQFKIPDMIILLRECYFHMFIFSTQPIGCWFLIVICPPDLLGRESPMIIRAGCVPARGDFMCSFLVRPEVSGLVFNCHMPACRHAGNAQK